MFFSIPESENHKNDSVKPVSTRGYLRATILGARDFSTI